MVSYQYKASYLGGAIIFISLWALPARAETASEANSIETQNQQVEMPGNKEAQASEELDRMIPEKPSVLSEAVDEDRWYSAIANAIESPQPVAEKSQAESTELSARQEPVGADEKLNSDATLDVLEAESRSIQPPNISDPVAPSVPAAENHKVNEIEQFSTSAEGLLPRQQPRSTFSEDVQISQSVVQVTGVRLNATASGLEVILETPSGQVLQAKTRIEGKSAIADIENAQLALPEGGEFRERNPDGGIAEVTVTQLEGSRIRVSVTGEKAAPTAQVVNSVSGLVLGVTPSAEEKIEIIVTARQATPYRVPNASTATRTDTPIRDIPQSIQVVPQEVLEDQQVVQLRDALRNVSGVTQSGNYGGTGSGPVILRGFSQDVNFRNGFRNNDFYSISETANVERIDVLKGPASVLFGQTQPGGIVNIVTKQPLSEPYYAVEFTAGQFSFYRPSIDISGPLNADRTLLYRLNVAYQNSGSFRDYVNTERIFIAPVVTWNIGDNTALTVDFEYLYDDPVFDRGITALNDGSLVLPIDRFLGYPKLDDYYTTTLRGGYTFEHRFSENWRIRNALSIRSDRRKGSHTDITGSLGDDGLLPRELRVDDIVNENYGIQTELTGNFATGSIRHQLLAGLDLDRRTGFGRGQEAELPPIDIFNPNYDIERPTELSNPFGTGLNRINTLGVYIQDQVTILDNLKLLIGGRFDSTEQSDRNITFGTSSSQSDQAFSPRIGIVYQPIQPISLYASYSRSFLPVIGRSATNTPFNPERGTQYEAGIKADITDRLSATFAVYQITKSNVLTSDPENRDFSIQVGEQRSRGVELDVAGEILRGLRIIATYAYTDAKITEDNVYPVGSRLFNVPEHTASLWTTYEIQNGSFQGLGFGAGLFYVGDRPRDVTFDPPGFELPSYLRTDAVVYYRRNNWQAQINLKNLFNNKYYETGQGYDVIYPGEPFNVSGTIRWEF